MGDSRPGSDCAWNSILSCQKYYCGHVKKNFLKTTGANLKELPLVKNGSPKKICNDCNGLTQILRRQTNKHQPKTPHWSSLKVTPNHYFESVNIYLSFPLQTNLRRNGK